MELRPQHKDAAEVNEWIMFGTRIAMSATFHPLEYAKVLIQLGYEPIAPQHGKSLFRSDVLVLPNIFKYVDEVFTDNLNQPPSRDSINIEVRTFVNYRGECYSVVLESAFKKSANALNICHLNGGSLGPKGKIDEFSRNFEGSGAHLVVATETWFKKYTSNADILRTDRVGRNSGGAIIYFKKVSYIRQVDGFAGCYRGLGPKLVGIIVSSVGSEKIALKLGFEKITEDKSDETKLSEEESDKKFLRELKRDIVLSISAVTLSHPFQVISVRMMAQFIGNETTYKTIWSSIKEIWNTEGIFGFFSGYTPKLLCEVSCLVVASSATYMINKHIVHDRDGNNHIGTLISFVAATLFYPMHVVSTCMKVTGSRLKAGQPPQMPIYESWSQCWRELKAAGDDKRGSSMFFRYYKTQPVFRNEVPFPKLLK